LPRLVIVGIGCEARLERARFNRGRRRSDFERRPGAGDLRLLRLIGRKAVQHRLRFLDPP
jgi:hypothetical protein